MKLFKRVEALQLWRKMLSMLFETGHPWITFKDPPTSARRKTMWASSTAPTCAPRSSSTPRKKRRPSATSARSTWRARHRERARREKTRRHHPHCRPHARQRDRHQLLSDRRSTELPTCATAPSALASWASKMRSTS